MISSFLRTDVLLYFLRKENGGLSDFLSREKLTELADVIIGLLNLNIQTHQ